MRISLARFNGGGASALVADIYEDEFPVVEGNSYSGKQACLKAAERLRAAADKFDALALEDNPFSGHTVNKINQGGA